MATASTLFEREYLFRKGIERIRFRLRDDIQIIETPRYVILCINRHHSDRRLSLPLQIGIAMVRGSFFRTRAITMYIYAYRRSDYAISCYGVAYQSHTRHLLMLGEKECIEEVMKYIPTSVVESIYPLCDNATYRRGIYTCRISE